MKQATKNKGADKSSSEKGKRLLAKDIKEIAENLGKAQAAIVLIDFGKRAQVVVFGKTGDLVKTLGNGMEQTDALKEIVTSTVVLQNLFNNSR